MKINWHKNPLCTTVELNEQDKRELRWKIRAAELLELLEEAHVYLQDGPQFDLTKARKAVSADYYLAEDGASKLDERVDVLLAHFIGELSSNHVGDCTCVSSSCSKCHAESLLGIDTIPGLEKHAAHKIAGAFGRQNEASLDEAIESLRTYDPKAPVDLESWSKVGGWEKHVPRWKSEAAAAHAWLVDYRNRYFPSGTEDTPERHLLDRRAEALRIAKAEVERCSVALSHAHARLSEAERGQS